MQYKTNKACRVCGSRKLAKFLDLGVQPLANGFMDNAPYIDEPKFPLRVYLCQKCGLVQLLDVVDPNLLFKDYKYYTGTSSSTLPEHFKNLAEQLSKEYHLTKHDLVIDIGGNDGTFLKNLKSICKILNVEPAEDVSHVSVKNGVPTFNDYFNTNTALTILNDVGKAKIITASNVFAHIDNLYDVMAAARMLLEDDGVFIIEVQHFLDMFKNFEFDQIYHEHLSYFTMNPLMTIGTKFGLRAFKVEKIPIHGGSLRIYFAGKNFPWDSSLWSIAVEKIFSHAPDLNSLQKWSKNASSTKEKLTNLLYKLRKEGKTIAGYGAPAKGNTLLNYCRIGAETLDYITDGTPAKVGKFSPGMHIPIVSKDEFHATPPDYALLLAWNYKDEILKQEQSFIEKGGKFIVPIPTPEIISCVQ